MKSFAVLLMLACLMQTSYAYFWVKGNKLMDSKGNEFMCRGVNTANGDWDKSVPPDSYYDGIKSTGANCIRIQWLDDAHISQKGLGDNDLKIAIQKAIDRKMIPIVELWSYTGSTDKNDLVKAGAWWAKRISWLKQFEDKLLINIANEWSNWEQSRDAPQPGRSFTNKDWVEGYKSPIKQIRDAGWKGALIVDSAAYAQSAYVLLKFAKELLKVDGNLLFSLHLYADWREASKYDNVYTPYNKNQLETIVDSGIALIIGEFADKHPDSACKIEFMDAKKIMAIAQKKRIGYLGWSWKGNGKTCMELAPILDIAKEWNCKSNACLTSWGNILVNDANGIRATSKIASVF